MSENQLDDLLLAWQEEQEQGRDVSAAELCHDCPELAAELNRCIAVLRRINDLKDFGSQPERSAATVALPRDKNGADTQPSLSAGPSAVVEPRADNDSRLPTLSADTPSSDVLSRSRSPAGYEILGELGRGGMGVVYKARQTGLRRIVALKMIRAGSHAHQSELARFRTEAEAIARLQHPRIVQIYEVGDHEGLPFFSLEFCGGGSLEKKLAGTPHPPDIAAALVEKVARAVQVAHDNGVIHRDLKPSNILLQIADSRSQVETQQAEEREQSTSCDLKSAIPKITDFGLAKMLDEAGQTQTGSIMGTPSYMAPEQATGSSKQLGPGCDIYALGAVLYEMLTGRPPFKAATPMDTLLQVTRDEPVPPRRLQPKLPQDLETICLKCLRKEPEKRYASALALAEDLERFRNGKPVRARPTGQFERAWRWCRRNPAVAASLLGLGLALLAGTVVSAVFGFLAQAHAQQEEAAKTEADRARHDAQRQLVELCGSSGMAAARDGDHALALLWFARAVQLAKDDPRQEELNRIRINNWLRQVCLPEGTFAVPGFKQNIDRFRAFEFSPDGDYLLALANTGDCLVWDRVRGRLVTLPKAAAKGSAAVWQPRSNLLTVGDEAGMVRFFAGPDFQQVEQFSAGAGIRALVFTRDGKRLAWGGAAGARVWDRQAKAYRTPLLPHPRGVRALSFSSSGAMLATAGGDDKARVFRVPSEVTEPLFPAVKHWRADDVYSHLGPDVATPRFAAKDRVLITAELLRPSFTVLKWRSATTGKLLPTRSDTNNLITAAFAVSQDGKYIGATGEVKGRLLDAQTGEVLLPIPSAPHLAWYEHVIFSADGQLLVTCGHDTRARFWSVEDRWGETLIEPHPPVYHPMQAVRVSLSDDSGHLATALWDGTVYLWRLPAGVPVAYSASSGGASLPVLSPDKKLVLPRGVSMRSGTQLRTRVYDADTGRPAGPMLDPGGIILDAAFSPDGAHVAIACSTAQTPEARNERIFAPAGKGGNVQIWDWKTGKRLVGPLPTPGEPRGLVFQPGGRRLAVVCADYRVLLVDAGNGNIVRQLDSGLRTRPQNANQYFSNGDARFSPDGRFLVTWELTPHVHVWDPEGGQLLHTLPHSERVRHVRFNPAAPEVIATVGWGSDARVWNLRTGKLLTALKHPQWVAQVEFSPDGKELITSADDGLLRVWDWSAATLQNGWPLHSAPLWDFRFSAERRWLTTLTVDQLQVSDWLTKSPVTPPWSLKPHYNIGLDLSAEGRRALVGGFFDDIHAYDQEAMLKPAAGTPEDLAVLAELAAGRRIQSQGNIVPLNSAEWLKRWNSLREKGAQVKGSEKDLEVSRLWFDGTLTASQREQSHPIVMHAGQTYTIDLESSAFDAYLRLVDDQGKVLAENDDIGKGTNLNARLVFSPERDTTCRIVATSFQGRGSGAYALTVRVSAREN